MQSSEGEWSGGQSSRNYPQQLNPRVKEGEQSAALGSLPWLLVRSNWSIRSSTSRFLIADWRYDFCSAHQSHSCWERLTRMVFESSRLFRCKPKPQTVKHIPLGCNIVQTKELLGFWYVYLDMANISKCCAGVKRTISKSLTCQFLQVPQWYLPSCCIAGTECNIWALCSSSSGEKWGPWQKVTVRDVNFLDVSWSRFPPPPSSTEYVFFYKYY